MSILAAISLSGAISPTLIVPINETVHISETDRFSKILMEENSQIVLPAFQSFHIQKLVAKEGARIRLAYQGSGGEGFSGGQGASSRFFIREISGHIVIEAKGGDGSNGKNGLPGRQGLEGMPGRRARTVAFGLIYLSRGEDGKTGNPGENGLDGEDGGNGGEGGNIRVYYSKRSASSKILVNVSGGRGGSPGRGGLGGLGGIGGPGGRGWPAGRQGLMGRSGVNGKAGLVGRPGKSGTVGVYQISETLFDCLHQIEIRSRDEILGDEEWEACSLVEGLESDGPIFLSTSVNQPMVDDQQTMMIQANGENGIHAVPGSSVRSGSPGSPGGMITIIFSDLPERMRIEARGGQGGNGAYGRNGTRGYDGQDGKDETGLHLSEPGTNGGPGENAEDGGSGGDGGEGGKVRIIALGKTLELDPNWRLHFEVDVSGGPGGSGGAGGIGGPGGAAGLGGKPWGKNAKRIHGLVGTFGANGASGNPGRPGSDGVLEFFEAESFAEWIVAEFKKDSATIFLSALP